MRYTLRLLTRQQFERAARMICAMELIRREHPERLGEEPIDVGIWVGSEISPNRFAQAMERVKELVAGRPAARHALLVERCPWCRAPFDATRGYDATEDDFHFRCTNGACAFGADDRPLPCNVVDEALYRSPPSLLIGTIDKFARVAWETRTGAFFGIGAGRRSRPPELVIQDELHLITGPLGSIAGLYEAGIDTLLTRRGVRPKYVASTATIHMAKEQVRRLYARDLAVFRRRACPATTRTSPARTGSVPDASTSATWRLHSISSTVWRRSPPRCWPVRWPPSTVTRTGTRCSTPGGPR